MADKTIVAVSGGFDPIHIGHVRMFDEAKRLGDELVVILNNDNWLISKKGFVFMSEDERKEIIESMRSVSKVVVTDHPLGDYNDRDYRSVCNALRAVRPDIFANGGDRKPDGDPVPEVALCVELGIEMVYNLGRDGKVQSSSWLTERIKKKEIPLFALFFSLTPLGRIVTLTFVVVMAFIGAFDLAKYL